MRLAKKSRRMIAVAPAIQPVLPVAACRGEGTRADWRRIVQAVLLVLLPCACHWPALRGEFLLDDLLITHSPLLGSWGGSRETRFSTGLSTTSR